MTRRSLSLSAILIALALVGLLVWQSFDREPSATDDDAANEDAVPAGLMRTDVGGNAGLAPGAVAAADDTEGGTEGPVTVTVLGFAGAPLAGVPVLPTGLRTDEAGRVVLPTVPWDGSEAVWLTTAEHELSRTKLTGSRVTLGDVGVPVELRPRHAVRGADVGLERTLKQAFTGGEAATPTAIATMTPGTYRTVTFETGKTEAGLIWEPAYFPGPVAPWSEKLVGELPVRPAANIQVVFPAEVPADIAASWKPQAVVARRGRYVSVTTDAFGRSRLEGVAHYPGEPVDLYGAHEGWLIGGSGTLPYDPSEWLRIELRAERIHPDESMVDDHVEIEEDLDFEETIEEEALAVEPEKSHPVLLRVLRFDGKAARGAIVRVGRGTIISAEGTADERGELDLGKQPLGELDCVVWGAGAPLVTKIEVKVGVEVVSVRAVRGGTVGVEAVDTQGRPLPFARVEILQPSNFAWMDVNGTTQRVDSFVDHLGKRTCHMVEPGKVRVGIYFGSRSATKHVIVQNGRHTSVKIEVPDATER